MNNGSAHDVRKCPVCVIGKSYFNNGSYAACYACQAEHQYIFQSKGRKEGIRIAKRLFKSAAFIQKLLRTLPAGSSTAYIYGSDPR